MNEICDELTLQEMDELARAGQLEPVFDDDSPMMTEEMLRQFRKMETYVIS